MYQDPVTGIWYTAEGVPISQAADGQAGSYLPGWDPNNAAGPGANWQAYQDSGNLQTPAYGTLPPVPQQPPAVDPDAAYGSQTPPAAAGMSGGGSAVPGTRDYPNAGGKSFFSYPDWIPPDEGFSEFEAPEYNLKPFVGPTKDTFTADPGYDFRLNTMTRALKNDRSARGLAATGGTLADLMSMAGGLASQEFGNVYNRDLSTWNANKGYEDSAFTRGLTSYLTKQQAKADDWTRNLQTYTTNLGKEASTYGMNLDTSQLNLGRDNAQFGNLTSLYSLMTRNLPTYTPTVPN